ncbi:MAG: fumarate hydratase [Patescibacteria group bacterium]|jgi:tartrate/fumarate subfamily iron-sulfur-dependent hydro-lyase alpha chain
MVNKIIQQGNTLIFKGKPTRSALLPALQDLYRVAIHELPSDVVTALTQSLRKEHEPRAKHVLKTMLHNIALAKTEHRSLCQDTGIPLLYVQYQSKKYKQLDLKRLIKDATTLATQHVPLRANALDIITGKVVGNYPVIYFKETKDRTVIQLLLKGGGSENVSRVYQLPDVSINAERDLAGIERCVLDTVMRAQGRGCPPYIIGVAVCGNMEEASYRAKNRHILPLAAHNKEPKLAALEKRLLKKINQLGIGPMGIGGNTTALSVKSTVRYVHPASWFVGVSVGCWSMRRATLILP